MQALRHIVAVFNERLAARVHQVVIPSLSISALHVGVLSDAGAAQLPLEIDRLKRMLQAKSHLLTVFVTDLGKSEVDALLAVPDSPSALAVGVVVDTTKAEVWDKLAKLRVHYRFIVNVGQPLGRWGNLFPALAQSGSVCDMHSMLRLGEYIESMVATEAVKSFVPEVKPPRGAYAGNS